MIVLGVLLGILVLILLLPVGATASYHDDVLVKLIIGPFRKQLVPAKPKSRKQLEKAAKKKAKKDAKKAEQRRKNAAKKLIQPDPKPESEIKEPLKDKIAGLIPFAKLAVDALGSVFRKLTITNFTLHIRLGSGNKAKLGTDYGKALEAAAAVRPILRRAFRVKRGDVSILPDFLADKTTVDAELRFRFFVFDLIGIALKYGVRGIKLLFARKKQQKKRIEALQLQQSTELQQSQTDKKAV